MAGEQITVAVTQVDEQRRGYMAISLDEWTSTNEPEITEGSRVEIKNALFKFPANEDIDASAGWGAIANDTQVYGYFVVAGANITCELTTTEPEWDEEFQGWYTAIGSTNRFWGGIYKDSGGNYADKFIYEGRTLKYTDTLKITEIGDIESEGTTIISRGGIDAVNQIIMPKVIEIGDWNMDLTATKTVLHGLTLSSIRSFNVLIRNDANTEYWDFGITSGGYSAYAKATTTAISMQRNSGEWFDQATFATTPYNRGWITIWHEV